MSERRIAFLEAILSAARRVVTLPPHADAEYDDDRRRVWTAQMSALIEELDRSEASGSDPFGSLSPLEQRTMDGDR